MDQIKQQFEKWVSLKDDDWQIFSSRLEKKDFPRNHLLLKSGEIENYLSFLEKGIIRYFIPEPENEITFDFAFEGEFMSGYDSFLTRIPTIYQIESLTDISLLRISYEHLQEMYNNLPIGNQLGRFAAEGLYLKKTKREKDFLAKTAEERYLELFSEKPGFLKYIPLKYIASYIGITPQALSRIRRRIT